MNLFIAETFTRSLGDLNSEEQGQAKATAFEFHMNPANPGFKFHRLDKAKDPHFWSVRVNRDVRIIVHKTDSATALCYVAHHDEAYKWGESRKFVVHPTTGAIQIVEVVERTEEIVKKVVKPVEVDAPFIGYASDYLLALGVPAEWIDRVQRATEDEFMEFVGQLPEEAAERLLELAAGNPVPIPAGSSAGSPFDHPDAKRRFRMIDRQQELRQALEFPWEQWIVFLHPSQQEVVDGDFSGPVRVSGSAGTGKTVVALHRAGVLARRGPKARVLLTTFSKTLASRLRQNADRLLGSEASELERIEICHLHKLAREIWMRHSGRPFRPAQSKEIAELIEEEASARGFDSFTPTFVRAEWDALIDPNCVRTWEEYRRLPRTGRGTPLGVRQRRAVWGILERVWARLEEQGLITWDQLCHETAALVHEHPEERFDHVISDEIQDFGIPEIYLLRALVPARANDLFLCGDPGQRIYKGRCSWRSLGVDVRGRSFRLNVNYRTTEQIRRFADELMPATDGPDEGEEESRFTVSLLQGRYPQARVCASVEEEVQEIAVAVDELGKQGFKPGDIAIFARTEALLKERVDPALELSGVAGHRLSDEEPPSQTEIPTGTMHRAKGLEFKAVLVVGCDEQILPLKKVLEKFSDPADEEEFLEQERQLLYVACTRARERLLVTFSGAPSAFLTDVLKTLE